MVEELDLTSAKPVVTPGIEELAPGDSGIDTSPLDEARAGHSRALVARANYIAVDRADAQFSINELCRGMSSPTGDSWLRLKRLVKYLKGRPGAVIKFAWQ